ncbi:MAG: hypothetical protein LBR80_12460 [Deltaproteobacteria bacterium]|nr:hypothetical protein [Deltaproteobacteria bacterium]
MDLSDKYYRMSLGEEISSSVRRLEIAISSHEDETMGTSLPLKCENSRLLRVTLTRHLIVIRQKWASRQVTMPGSTLDMERLVNELRSDLNQGIWVREGLQAVAADGPEADRWLDSIEGPLTAEAFFERYVPDRTIITVPVPSQAQEEIQDAPSEAMRGLSEAEPMSEPCPDAMEA